MTIKEVEEQLGITRANIRFYEKEGLVIPKRNSVNSYREYENEDVEILRKILFLRKLDVSIEDIRSLQNEKITLNEFLESHQEYLNERAKGYESLKTKCRTMIKNSETDYKTLDVNKYGEEGYKNDYVIIRDTISNLAMIKDKVLIGILIIIEILNGFISYFLLPEQIPVEWAGMQVASYGNKLFIFLYPLLSILILLVLKIFIPGIIHIHMPLYMHRSREIGSLIGLGFVIVFLSCQTYTLLYLRGVSWSLDSMILTEIFVFYIAFIGYTVLSHIRKKTLS